MQSKIVLNAISVDHMKYDISDCLQTTSEKITKRLGRLRTVCVLKGDDFQKHVDSMNVLKEQTTIIPDQDILDFLESGKSYEDDIVDIVMFPPGTKDFTISKMISAALTSKLNRDSKLYKLTCKFLVELEEHLKKDPVLARYYEAGWVFLVLKGSVAQRLVLIAKYPDEEELINEFFSFGGDNDCQLIFDSTMPFYEVVRERFVKAIHDFMCSNVHKIEDIIMRRAAEVTEITIGGLTIPVHPTIRNSFSIKDYEGQTGMKISEKKSEVYVSNNDALDFADQSGRKCHFTLLRIKQAFQVKTRKIGAEVLDIAISHKDDIKCSSPHVIEKYRSGHWMTKLELYV